MLDQLEAEQQRKILQALEKPDTQNQLGQYPAIFKASSNRVENDKEYYR